MPLYDEICSEFGFSKQADRASARLLASIIGDKGRGSMESMRRGFPKQVLLCGGSRSLADELSSIVFDGFVVAADGATTTLLESGFKVDMIVTDLDGIVEDQIDQNSKGTTVFLHAHGDNQSAIRRHADKFAGPLVGTCQSVPPPQLYNFGGFTDGDRAACICAELDVAEILLAGFDFENPSKKTGRDVEIKRRKLAWARRILDMLRQDGMRIISASELPR
ncbi:MAG: hypothetical protein A3K76_04410 [Euryarchaeota archaeon RBG_13_57_23]|nr:MAG: hypothetical protein A3K76_04410 [Euryarchaeota archaeon RBG_13_57_23]